MWALISIVRFQSDIFSQSQAWKVGRLSYRHILVCPLKVGILWEDHDAWYSYCRLVAEDRTPVALFEVNMKSIFIFLSVSILELLAVKRSAEGKFTHFLVSDRLLLKRSALVIYSRSTCFCTAVQFPVWNSASLDSSPIRMSRICLINILNYSF